MIKPRWQKMGWLLMLIAAGCGGDNSGPQPRPTRPAPSPFQVGIPTAAKRSDTDATESFRCRTRFTPQSAAIGLNHTYQNGERGRCLMVETIGGGCGWLDYDADGHWDLYLNQGGDPTAEVDDRQPNDALFRNLGDGSFLDVTDAAGIVELGYSQAVAIGDYDNDGFDDVYVTNTLANTLFHNLGDGTFQDVTAAAGVGDSRWSASAAWADLDADGDLDLYVCNYCDYDAKNPLECKNPQGEDRVCHPRDIEPWPDECYINQGDGTFTPEAKSRGLYGDENRALGVAIADLNNDGLPDIYVNNDATANFLFLNQGDGQFQEMALPWGCAVDRNGAFQASMGIAVADYDRNGFLDMYITHFHLESNTLYRNLGPAGFHDETGLAGLHQPTLNRLSFGVVMADFCQDGRPEIFTTSGHIENYPGNPLHKMAPQYFVYIEDRWREYTDQMGEFFTTKRVGRGVATCDYDEDGDVDLIVAHENSPAVLLRNESERGHWLKFQFRGIRSNRRGIGCRVTVTAGGTDYVQELCGGTSFAATHQPVLVFGLGDWSDACDVSVRWPDGTVQDLASVEVDRVLMIEEPRSGEE